jgi:hypothetical protein
MIDQAEIDERLKVIKAEVDQDFPGLVAGLEAGLQVAVVTEPYPNLNFHPEGLRRIGGMVMLCRHYGAVVGFANEGKFAELNSRNRSIS